ncbi:MAG: DnaJ domain-containing protein [Alphaproteobacteria bacterium]|nr:DnaJ domain-containing protein [Alphaproteobacteria bacterium]
MPRKKQNKKYFAPQRETHGCKCDFPGCTKAGEYRAPKDRSLKEYYWFCLEHVQAYNAKWNYYDSEDDTDSQKADNPKSHLHFGSFRSKIKYQFGYDFRDELGYLGEFTSPFSSAETIYFSAQEREYIRLMELSEEDISLAAIKKQYKKLVKKYHPDVNRNDKNAEEKFKQLSAAYKALLDKLS